MKTQLTMNKILLLMGFAVFSLWGEGGEPLSNPVAFSRDKAIAFGLTNGVYSVRHWGKSDWAVTAFPEVKVKPGDTFTYSVDVAKKDAGECHASVVLRFSDGRVKWGYASRSFTQTGVTSWSFAVPPGAKSIQARFGGLGAFQGELRNLRLESGRSIPLSVEEDSWLVESDELKVRVLREGGALEGITEISAAGELSFSLDTRNTSSVLPFMLWQSVL